MPNATILVVDDEPLIRWSLVNRLKEEGYRTAEAGTASEAVAQHRDGVDLVLLDYALPDANGLEVLRQVKETDPDTLVIMLTANTEVGVAVEAMKRGAFHHANKPFDLDEVVVLVEKALETTQLRREVRLLRTRQAQPYGIGSIVGESEPIGQVRTLLNKIGVSPASTVLLTGESGTGKDLAAKVIHYSSSRANKPFMNITCSALPETLLESELFGHERGAFTGADRQKRGLIESADGGTVFLDEIGEMVPLLQAKLLRFLEEKSFKRVGGAQDVKVDVRVIAATNRSLQEEVKKGHFREDLFYRLNVMSVSLPTLRERRGDVPLLINHYIDIFNTEFRKKVRGVAPATLAALQAYPWRGNVRELRNAVERAMLLAEGNELSDMHFPMLNTGEVELAAGMGLPPEGINLEGLERSLVVQALERSAWNQTKAATLLGLNRDQIRYRIEKFELHKPAVS
ncbi:MAG TPA: sigma-54 dependent transcriptional regulator [Vicinamibacterales bacterium]